MIPYYPPPVFELAGVRLDSWLVLVVLGIAIGTEFARARAIRKGLSVKLTVDCTLAMVASGFVVAHIIHVLVYNYDKFLENPSWILPIYGGYSSTGGFLGALIAIPLYLVVIKKAPIWAYLDNMAIGFILGWTFGRAGCFSAHDHMGDLSNFFLAVNFPGGARHDLGLYESLGCATLFVVMLILDRKERFHGFFAVLCLLWYAPMRFGLDFLRGGDLEDLGRRSDIRYLGLTPAQYGALFFFGLGVWMFFRRRNAGRQDTSAEAARDFGPGQLPPSLSPDGATTEAENSLSTEDEAGEEPTA